MKKKGFIRRTSAMLVVFGTLFISCNDHVSSRGSSSNELIFAPTVSKETKAGYFGTDNLSSIGIYAYYTESSNFVWENRSPNFMNNQLIRRIGGSAWIYYPTRYWPVGQEDRLSFFAYAPHNSALAQTDGSILLDTTTSSPSLIVTIPSKQKNQADVLVSSPMLNKHLTNVDNGLLPLSFSHALSSIDFQAQSTTGSVQIFSIKVYYTSGVKRTGKVSLSTGSWIGGTLQGSYPSVDGTSEAKKDTILGTATTVGSTVTNLTSASDHLLLIPQTLNAGDIKVEISYALGGTSFVKTISLPAQTYTAGNNYPVLFEFGAGEIVYPIPLPSVPISLNEMCGCGYDRVTNPHHNLSHPHYDANNLANTSWVLRAKEDWTSTLQFKNKVDFFIYGRYTVSSWWGGSSNGKLYVMPGGILDLRNISGFNTDMHVVNFGTILLPNNLSINANASLTSATALDASNTNLNIGGSLTLYANSFFNDISTYGSSVITAHKCLTVASKITLSNTAKLYVNSYVEASSLIMNTSSQLYLASQSMIKLLNPFSIDYAANYRIINASEGYAVFKCPSFVSKIPNTSSMMYGKIDIHGTILNESWVPTVTWDSRIKLNGNTLIPADGCRPAYP